MFCSKSIICWATCGQAGAYSALLGPIGGILIADYFVWRRRTLDLAALYKLDGEYRFTNGFSVVALVAVLVGALPSVPGFLVKIKALSSETVPPFVAHLYNYAWFLGFAIAFTLYLVFRKLAPKA